MIHARRVGRPGYYADFGALIETGETGILDRIYGHKMIGKAA
jgi:hypothetical protein